MIEVEKELEVEKKVGGMSGAEGKGHKKHHKKKAEEVAEKPDWKREEEPVPEGREVGAGTGLGTQCKGLQLVKRYMREKGTQLGETEVAKMAWKESVKPPHPSYLILKFLAETLAVMAEMETKAAAVEGRELDQRLAVIRILGLLDKTFLASGVEGALRLGGNKLQGALTATLTAEETTALRQALEFLPRLSPLRKLKLAMTKRNLLSLEQLSDLIYTLGFGLDQTVFALKSTIEGLAQTEENVIGEDDTEHYSALALQAHGSVERGRSLQHPLIYGPRLASGHGYLHQGAVLLKRINAIIAVRELPKGHWLSLKVLAVLYDVLSHQKDAVGMITGKAGVKWQMLSLGAIDRSFMRAEQKNSILQGRRANLNAAELDPLMELSTAAKHASTDPRRHVAKAAKRVQKHILENYLFNINELRDLFMDLSHRFYIPLPLYNGLISRLEELQLIKSSEGAGILSKVKNEEKTRGILLLNHLPHFMVVMGKQMEAYEGNVEAGSEDEQEEESKMAVVTEAEVMAGRGYELVPGPRLGEGRYSKVRAARVSATGEGRAVKIMDKTKFRPGFYEHYVRRELELLPRLRHPGIVRCYEVFEVGQKVFEILELGTGGDLLGLVQERGAQGEAGSRRWILQLLSALAYLHSRRVAHRDVKLENLIVVEAGEGGGEQLRLADFTFARRFERRAELSGTYCGSKAYSCPEILSGQPYSPWKADAFAAGVVLYILLLGRMPFNERVPSNRGLIEQMRREVHFRHLPGRLSPNAVNAVTALLAFNPIHRPDVTHALATLPFLALLPAQHPFPPQQDQDNNLLHQLPLPQPSISNAD